MEKTQNFKSTVFACYRGYITQGIVNNLSPCFRAVPKQIRHFVFADFGTYSVQLCDAGHHGCAFR